MMKTRWFILVLTAASLISSQAKSDLSLKSDEGQGEIEIHFKGQLVFIYAFATNQFKPYVRELYTLNGENVLRDSPPDHLHHHGLMYAVRVNGVNFWEEKDAPGVQRPIRLLAQTTGKNALGLPQARFTQLVHWLASTNLSAADSSAVALLVEQRTLTLTVDERKGEVSVQWDAVFEVGPGGKVTLTGSDYNGLGLRLPQSFDHVAAFQNSEKSPYVGANRRDNIQARWTSVTGKTAKGEITLALFGDRANPGGATSFFTMLDPFAYLSATQRLNREPLAYASGDKFRLRYLLSIYNGPRTEEFLEQRYEAWGR